MEIGGAESALIGLLQAIDYSRYDVDLFLHAHRGEMMQFIPKEVNLLPEISAYACIESSMAEAMRRWQFGVLLGRLKAKWRARRYKSQRPGQAQCAIYQYVAQEVESHLPSLHQLGDYDLAVSFLQPHNYVLSKVKAKKKACWIHTDYTKVEFDVGEELPVWTAFDYIVGISPETIKAFLQVFPSLESKTVEMENILSPKFVRSRADDDLNDNINLNGDGKVVKLLSVGRFSDAKNYDNVPDICRRIIFSLFTLHSSLSVRWFLIGYGGLESLIRQKIKEAGMEEHVIIFGKRTNPYPYIKACDIYVQPSRYEGKSVTVREAQMLCKPVVVTNYTTASSQIQDGIDGRIVPMDNEGCAKGIADLILDKELQQRIVDYLQTHDYGNEKEIEKFYKLIP